MNASRYAWWIDSNAVLAQDSRRAVSVHADQHLAQDTMFWQLIAPVSLNSKHRTSHHVETLHALLPFPCSIVNTY